MNTRNIFFTVGMLVLVIGLAMLTALGVGFLCHDSCESLAGMGWSCLACICGSLACLGMSCVARRRTRPTSSLRDGFLSVFISWIAAVIFGALPFVLCCGMRIPDAIFETASGFSTTGASVIEPGLALRHGLELEHGLESMPMSALYWRSVLNWLGGIGFVMFVLMLLPPWEEASNCTTPRSPA